MNSDDQLSHLLSAERAEAPSSAATARGLSQLRSALGANAAGLGVGHGPLKLGLSLAVRWAVGSGVVVFAALSGTVGFSAKAASTAHAPPSVSAPSPPSSAPPFRAPEPAPAEAPEAPAVRVVRSVPTPASSKPDLAASTFADELRLVKAAKRELDAGRDQAALAALDEHARLYPRGVFQTERDALTVLLACRRSPEQGRASAQRFREQNAASPLVDRISRACRLDGPAARAEGNFP